MNIIKNKKGVMEKCFKLLIAVIIMISIMPVSVFAADAAYILQQQSKNCKNVSCIFYVDGVQNNTYKFVPGTEVKVKVNVTPKDGYQFDRIEMINGWTLSSEYSLNEQVGLTQVENEEMTWSFIMPDKPSSGTLNLWVVCSEIPPAPSVQLTSTATEMEYDTNNVRFNAVVTDKGNELKDGSVQFYLNDEPVGNPVNYVTFSYYEGYTGFYKVISSSNDQTNIPYFSMGENKIYAVYTYTDGITTAKSNEITVNLKKRDITTILTKGRTIGTLYYNGNNQDIALIGWLATSEWEGKITEDSFNITATKDGQPIEPQYREVKGTTFNFIACDAGEYIYTATIKDDNPYYCGTITTNPKEILGKTGRATISMDNYIYGDMTMPDPQFNSDITTNKEELDILWEYREENEKDWKHFENITTTSLNIGNYEIRATVRNPNYDVTIETTKFSVLSNVKDKPHVIAINETIKGKQDGKTNGLTTEMEISDDAINYTLVTDVNMELAAGTYYVRYAKQSTYEASDPTIVVVEEGQPLKITFKADNRIIAEKETVWNGTLSDKDIPKIPAKVGYDQIAPIWDVRHFENITSDMTVEALYSINQYVITFVANGHTIDTMTVNHGTDLSTIELPSIPLKKGYNQNKPYWKLSGLTNIIENTTIEAVYTINVYTVSFDNGMTNQNVEYGKTVKKPADPVKEGYIFIGWYADHKEYDFHTPVTENIILTAKWEKQKETVVVEKNEVITKGEEVKKIKTGDCTDIGLWNSMMILSSVILTYFTRRKYKKLKR